MMVLIFFGMWLYGIEEARPQCIATCIVPVLLFILLGTGVVRNEAARYPTGHRRPTAGRPGRPGPSTDGRSAAGGTRMGRVDAPAYVQHDGLKRWVAEMADYPLGPPGGRVRVIEDRDRDGRADRSTIFAEGLPFPTSASRERCEVVVAHPGGSMGFVEDADYGFCGDSTKSTIASDKPTIGASSTEPPT